MCEAQPLGIAYESVPVSVRNRWPVYNPDSNPIETVWDKMKD